MVAISTHFPVSALRCAAGTPVAVTETRQPEHERGCEEKDREGATEEVGEASEGEGRLKTIVSQTRAHLCRACP